MADTLLPLDLPPGMRNTGTVYQSKGRWYTGSLVRFFNGTIQPVGGWTARTLTGAAISGVPRAMVSYRRNDNTQIIVVGTTRGLYAIVGGAVTDITPSEVVSNNAARVWQLDVFGAYLVAVDLIAPSTTGAMYYWNGDTATTGELVSPWSGSNPTLGLSVVTTPERFLVMLGGKYTASGWSSTGVESQFRMVTWATQEGGFTGSDWVPGAANSAGDFTLTTDGSLVCGRRTRGGTLLWTTTDLWTMTYIGGTFIFRFDQVGNKCGIISTRAAIVTDAASYWMGDNGFYVYDGFVKPLPCDVQDHVFGSFNRTYAHLVWALEHPTYGEVTWFYPSASATEVDRYVTYNSRENHWTTGTLSRTAGITNQPGTAVYPVMCDAAGVVYNHETGYYRYPSDAPYLESGPIEIGVGDRLMDVLRIIPDDRTLGDVSMRLYAARNPGTAETEHGPYTLAAETGVRLQGRHVRLRIDEVAPTDNIAWTARTTPNLGWGDVAYSSSLGLFAAVATNGATLSAAMTSPDGITWTQRSLGLATQSWNSVLWVPELAMFIATATGVAETTNIRTSTDGSTWTARTTDKDDIQAIAYNPTGPLLVAVTSSTDTITSSNGTAWTTQATSGLTNNLTDIAYSPALNLFVGIAASGATDSTQIYTSVNGIAWTARTGTDGISPTRVVWCGSLGVFVITSVDGLGVWTSSNGTAWTFAAFSGEALAFVPTIAVWAESIGRLFIFGGGADYLMSDDASTFTLETGVNQIWTGGVWASEENTLVVTTSIASTSAAATGIVPERDWRVGVVRLGVSPAGRR